MLILIFTFSSLQANIQILSEIKQAGKEHKILMQVDTHYTFIKNDSKNSELIFDYKNNDIYMIDHIAKVIRKTSFKDLIVQAGKPIANKKLESKNPLYHDIINEIAIDFKQSKALEKITIKKQSAKNNSIKKYKIFKDRRLRLLLEFEKPKKLGVSKKDYKLLMRSVKTLFVMQKAFGQVDSLNVEPIYLSLAKKEKLIFKSSVHYGFDPRYNKEVKVLKIQTKNLPKIKIKLPKDYTKQII